MHQSKTSTASRTVRTKISPLAVYTIPGKNAESYLVMIPTSYLSSTNTQKFH